MTEQLHFHFSLSCIAEGNGSPLQCCCLENPRDGASWWAAVYGVAQSRTRLKWLSSNSSSSQLCPTLLWSDGLSPSKLLCPWNFPGKNIGVDCPFLIQGIFLTQGLDLHLLHWQVDSLLLATREAHQTRSDQISCSVVSDSLRPHESQHTRPPCPS